MVRKEVKQDVAATIRALTKDRSYRPAYSSGTAPSWLSASEMSSIQKANSTMANNDRKLMGSFLGEKLMNMEEYEPDPWYVYLVKLVFVKDGVA
jgi:hypothetical protein